MKTEVYSWRVSPETKADLETEARRQNTSVASLLDQLTRAWLRDRRGSSNADDAEQARLHAAAEKLIGTLAGKNPRRAESVRTLVRGRLAGRHERERSH